MPRVPASPTRRWRRAGSAATAAVLALGLLLLGLAVPTAASADTAPAPGVPGTVSADALPTVQVNGVVWSMVTVGTTVYATGSFTQARPAGAAPGTQQTPRANLLAFNLTTGALLAGFDHTLNGQGRTITASPDGARIYVGGDFTTVNGVARGHIAAFSTATGALISGFAPTSNGAVYSLAATATTVYAGGNFTTAGGQSRTRLAAFSATDGALTAWAPTANNIVRGIVLNPDGTRVLLGGQFSQISGVPAIALASVNTAGGDVRTWDYGITNEGDNGGVYSLRTDGVNAYANTYGFQVGNIEGTVALDPTTLALVWMNDCHGDPYDTYVTGGVVYAVGHAHDCETSGSFPDLDPRVWKRGIAMTLGATGILKATTEVPRYGSWEGRPHPTVLNWWPTLNAGSYTGQYQGPWALTGSGDYIVMGGEFTTVNGVAQQSLVRFADSSVAPDRRGPELSAAAMRPNATAVGAGAVKVTWPQSWDMDNETLSYEIYRGSGTTPVHTVSATAQWWNGTLMSWTDTDRPAGSTASYRVVVRDPFGNSVTSTQSNSVTVTATTSPYLTQVLADGPSAYWRLGETSGTTAYDAVGTTNLTEAAGITRGTAGAVAGDAAVTADGTATGRANTAALVTEPATGFSVEAWVRTTSDAGGTVVQYGEQLTEANVANTDRALYVDAGGRASFGLTARGPDRVTRYTTVRSPQVVNDGEWHHLVATVGPEGTVLYVDGAQAAVAPELVAANPRTGPAYWLVGSGTLTGAPDAPSSPHLAGAVDEVAIYRTALTAAQVTAHHAAATGAPGNAAPTASFTAASTELEVAVDAAASTDADGTVTGYSWNWGDGTAAGSGATATHAYAAAGTYTITLTVTDDEGATGTTTEQVTVVDPDGPQPPVVLAADAFERSVTGGLGTADTGGPWTVAAGASRQAVTGGAAVLTVGPANNAGSYLGGVSATDTDVRTTLSFSRTPVNGTGAYAYVTGRRVGSAEYNARVRVLPGGAVGVSLVRKVTGVETTLGFLTLPGLTYTDGAPLQLHLRVTGTGTTNLELTVWPGDTPEPAGPTLVRTDGTAALQAPGGVGLAAYLSGSSSSAVAVRFDDLRVTAPGAAEPPANQPPAASFTATATGLSVDVDAAGSTDADGSIASWAWQFGDGADATGPTAAHTYATAGTYTVTLTVTDDDGATATTTRTVTVAATPLPAGDAFASDAFGRSITGGLGTADVGGAWTASAGASRQSVTPGTAVLGAGPGLTTATALGAVSQPDADVTATVAIDRTPTGGALSLSVLGRRVGAGSAYELRVRFLADGSVRLGAVRRVDGTETLLGAEVAVAGQYTPGTPLHLRVQVSGSGTTTVQGRAWTGTVEPTDWALARTDGTAALQVPGGVGLEVYLSRSATAAVQVSLTAFAARPVA